MLFQAYDATKVLPGGLISVSAVGNLNCSHVLSIVLDPWDINKQDNSKTVRCFSLIYILTTNHMFRFSELQHITMLGGCTRNVFILKCDLSVL